MTFGILRYPHQNQRYYEASAIFVENELTLILENLKQPHKCLGYKLYGGLSLYTFEMARPDAKVWQALYRMSTAMAFFEIEGDCLKPHLEGRSTYFKDDLASILKYSGKTNEHFTALMINAGVFSSAFATSFDTPLTIFDPMSGKGTTLFQALIKGYHSMGVEKDKNACVEMNQYFKRYLKYHQYKHEAKHQTIMQAGKNKGTKYTMITADTKEHFKKGETRTVQYSCGDTRDANLYYKKNVAHVMVADLPYGVQHGGMALMKVLSEAAKPWFQMLKKGGALVIAYNTHQMKREELATCYEAAGFKICSEGVYNQFEHWVEQAVNRDLLIVTKP